MKPHTTIIKRTDQGIHVDVLRDGLDLMPIAMREKMTDDEDCPNLVGSAHVKGYSIFSLVLCWILARRALRTSIQLTKTQLSWGQFSG